MTEPVSLNDALASVIKAAWCQNNLARGINESCRAIESFYNDENDRSALVILASDVKESGYTKLVQALAKQNNVPLITVDSIKQLGIWSGFAKYNKEGAVVHSRNCGVVVLKRWPQREDANKNVIQQHMAANN